MKQTLHLGVFSAINIAIALLTQWYIFFELGAGIETDSMLAGMTLPQFVLGIFSTSLLQVLVPMMAGEKENCIFHDAWQILYFIVGLFGFLSYIFYVTASFWVPVIFAGFSESAINLTIELTRIHLIGMIFTAINSVQLATYYAREKFLWAEFSPIIASVSSLALLVWFLPHYGVVAAAWISVIRILLIGLMLAPGIGRPISIDIRSAVFALIWHRIKHLLFGVSYSNLDLLIDRLLLSFANVGSLSLFFLSQQIYSSITQVINKSIVVPMVPHMSKFYKASDISGMSLFYKKKILVVTVISLSVLVLLALIRYNIAEFLFFRNYINVDNFEMLSWFMLWLSGSFVAGSVGLVSSSSIYASGDTKTLTRFGVYTQSVYIPIKLILFYMYGIKGLALSISMFIFINLIVQNWLIKTKYLNSMN
jgi:peptidoglycan biosynthesis protein MviN/MurJ (putative lipid II flippase)